jgi:hypothetical protein
LGARLRVARSACSICSMERGAVITKSDSR